MTQTLSPKALWPLPLMLATATVAQPVSDNPASDRAVGPCSVKLGTLTVANGKGSSPGRENVEVRCGTSARPLGPAQSVEAAYHAASGGYAILAEDGGNRRLILLKPGPAQNSVRSGDRLGDYVVEERAIGRAMVSMGAFAKSGRIAIHRIGAP